MSKDERIEQATINEKEARDLKRAVDKFSCRSTAKAHMPLIERYVGQMQQKGLKAKDAGIIIINVNTAVGKKLASKLVPKFDWQKIRNQGEIPYACGIVMREGFTEDLSMYDVEAGKKLRAMEDTPVVVFDHSTVEVFTLTDVKGITE